MTTTEREMFGGFLNSELFRIRTELRRALAEDPAGEFVTNSDDPFAPGKRRYRLKDNASSEERLMFLGALALQDILANRDDPLCTDYIKILGFAMMAQRVAEGKYRRERGATVSRNKRLGKRHLKDMEHLVLITAYLRHRGAKDWLKRVTSEVVRHRGGHPVSTKTVSRELKRRGIVNKS